ncbi:hypothetical protein R3X27_21195 [Tropicimonas sp. TH_r6]|uniref:hypothetical protein n=1 Tax=Tropicimonas sp. TH_r6 TaxID=3082085 RepID=UPI002953B320|nr:hypothetical protein [Tropicimonas sp. TH_r6]MDV7145207.1 hypothetical protein [Tropicimonas sp. TH_r6]
MMSQVKLPISVIAFALAAALPGVASALSAAELEVQRTAILECKRQQLVGGAAYIEQRSSGTATDRMAVQIAPYDQVTYQSADSINRCAAGKLGLGEAEMEQFNSRNKTVVRSIRAGGGYRNMSCGRNPSILYKGDLYCQWSRR